MANKQARESQNQIFNWLQARKKQKQKAGIKRGDSPAPYTTKDGENIPVIIGDTAKEYLKMRQELKKQGYLLY